MSSITLPVRYCRLDVGPGERWEEKNFKPAELTWQIDPKEAALVMVDVWDIHPYTSHRDRSIEITRDRIVPVAQACREAEIAVIHAPSPGQAHKYPQWVRYAGDAELGGAGAANTDEWPPAAFRQFKGKYAKYAKPKEPRRERWLKTQLPKRKIMPVIEPQPDDFVVATGAQLHRLLKHRRILHLFYAGFAANMCVLHRDYGIFAMKKRGYNIILLRDCTTAIENSDTLPTMDHTQTAISIVEMIAGYTTTSDVLIQGCRTSPRGKRRKGKRKS